MKFNSTVSIMPRRKHTVLAGIAVVLALTGTSPAFAGRQVHGADVARFLTGKGSASNASTVRSAVVQ